MGWDWGKRRRAKSSLYITPSLMLASQKVWLSLASPKPQNLSLQSKSQIKSNSFKGSNSCFWDQVKPQLLSLPLDQVCCKRAKLQLTLLRYVSVTARPALAWFKVHIPCKKLHNLSPPGICLHLNSLSSQEFLFKGTIQRGKALQGSFPSPTKL